MISIQHYRERERDIEQLNIIIDIISLIIYEYVYYINILIIIYIVFQLIIKYFFLIIKIFYKNILF